MDSYSGFVSIGGPRIAAADAAAVFVNEGFVSSDIAVFVSASSLSQSSLRLPPCRSSNFVQLAAELGSTEKQCAVPSRTTTMTKKKKKKKAGDGGGANNNNDGCAPRRRFRRLLLVAAEGRSDAPSAAAAGAREEEEEGDDVVIAGSRRQLARY